MSEDISSKVRKIVADHLGIDEAKITEDSSFIDDLGADSLDTVELVWPLKKNLEQRFQIVKQKKFLQLGMQLNLLKAKVIRLIKCP